jgi:hypothetical protein
MFAPNWPDVSVAVAQLRMVEGTSFHLEIWRGVSGCCGITTSELGLS